MEKKQRDIQEIFKSDENFLNFLGEAARSEEYRKKRQRAEQGLHPSPEILYDYVLNNLDEKEAGIVRKHIGDCGICAEEVLRIRGIEEELEQDLLRRAGKIPFGEFLKGLIPKWRMRMPHLAAGLCAAAILCWFIFHDETAKLIGESYHAAIEQNMLSRTLSLKKELPLPWEENVRSYGFASGRLSPANRAFGAGLWTGRANLSQEKEADFMPEFLSPAWQGKGDAIKENEWSETPWSLYFSMGEWCVLVQAVCLSDAEKPRTFWENQADILKQMREDFAQLPEDIRKDFAIAERSLGKVESALRDAEKKGQCETIAFEIGNLIKYLSPQSVPGKM